jgi:hypothetical protein
MMASDLIRILEQQIKEHGDHPMAARDGNLPVMGIAFEYNSWRAQLRPDRPFGYCFGDVGCPAFEIYC